MVLELEWDEEVDLVVLGTGAAGLAAGLTAAAEGLKVLVLEKTDYLGGTTAYSAGTCWVPGNPFQAALGRDDDIDQARLYLDTLVGDKSDPALRETYLTVGPRMVEYMDGLGVRFWHAVGSFDYHPELPGATSGRAMEPQTFDGRKLGWINFARVRPPVPEFALFGGTLMVRRKEVNTLLSLYRFNVRAVLTAVRLGARWSVDLLKYPRGTRLAMGNALVANMFHELVERGGRVWFNARTRELVGSGGRIVGVIVSHSGRDVRVGATRGVVLATGGFSASPDLRDRYLPKPTPQFTRAAEGATGDFLRLTEYYNAAIGSVSSDNAMWFPSSVGQRRDGSTMVFPHIWDRAKPGLVAVNAAGRRFCDESISYHRFVRAMYEENEKTLCVPAWLVVDSRFLRKYGLGAVHPHQRHLQRFIKAGYLFRDTTLVGLAAQIGVDAAGLAETVAANNRSAVTGRDERFGRGDSPFGHQYGDPRHRPNVNLGPINRSPFYALAVHPTPLATSLGLQIDTSARVLDRAGRPVPGLYAAGMDADSVMGDEYPGPGCQVGGGLIFGFTAARHAAKSRVEPVTDQTLTVETK